MHVDHTVASGAELIMGNARFVAPRTVEIDVNSGGTRTICGDRIFLDLGSRAAVPEGMSLSSRTSRPKSSKMLVADSFAVPDEGVIAVALAEAVELASVYVIFVSARPVRGVT